MSTKYQIQILSGSASENLAHKIALNLGQHLVARDAKKFNDGETRIEILENVRGSDLFIVQSTCEPVNDNLMELLLLVHTTKLASAARVTVVIPYFGYARQDRKTKPRVPISASLVARLIEASGADRVITIDLHCGQIQGFFHKIPVDNLYADKTLASHISTWLVGEDLASVVVVSPDAGGVERARRMADLLGSSYIATIMKRRVEAGNVACMQIVGDVCERSCLIIDDMIDSAGTLCAAASKLKENGANKVYACATHAVFSRGAIERIRESDLTSVIVTSTIVHPSFRDCRITCIDIAPLLTEAIRRIHVEESLSSLF